MVPLGSLPLEQRAEVARQLILHGEDPYMMLAAAVWPSHVAFYVEPPTPGLGFCRHGHPWNEENTSWRGPGKKWRRCRACDREMSKVWKRNYYEKKPRKVPCAYCGEPATAASDKGTGGLDTPRCRKCFLKHYRERRRAA